MIKNIKKVVNALVKSLVRGDKNVAGDLAAMKLNDFVLGTYADVSCPKKEETEEIIRRNNLTSDDMFRLGIYYGRKEDCNALRNKIDTAISRYDRRGTGRQRGFYVEGSDELGWLVKHTDFSVNSESLPTKKEAEKAMADIEI